VFRYAPIYENLAYVPSTEIAAARREIACLDIQLVKARNKWAEEKKVLNERWVKTKDRYDTLYNNLPRLNGYFKVIFNHFELRLSLAWGLRFTVLFYRTQ